MEDCDKGYKGDCCCNCKNLVKLHEHLHAQGVCQDVDRGFACMAYVGDTGSARLSDQHGMCEEHVRKAA